MTAAVALLEDLGAVGDVPAAPVFYERFGRALAQRRRGAGLSQETMAARIGLSRTSVTNIEAGRQSVSLHTGAGDRGGHAEATPRQGTRPIARDKVSLTPRSRDFQAQHAMQGA